MTIEQFIDNLQRDLNRGDVKVSDVKELIHMFNTRGQILADVHESMTKHRRLWRTEHIKPEKVGYMLSFNRKIAYAGVKLRHLLKKARA